LRVTSSDDPASFESGFDLLKPDGQLWSRPLFAVSRFYTPLYEKLREERLVPDDLDLSTFPHRSLSYGRGQYLYTLNDTFIVDFGAVTHNISVVTEQGMETLIFSGPFCDRRHGVNRGYNPYTGAYTNHDLSILLD
jgi:hypothetical protein